MGVREFLGPCRLTDGSLNSLFCSHCAFLLPVPAYGHVYTSRSAPFLFFRVLSPSTFGRSHQSHSVNVVSPVTRSHTPITTPLSVFLPSRAVDCFAHLSSNVPPHRLVLLLYHRRCLLSVSHQCYPPNIRVISHWQLPHRGFGIAHGFLCTLKEET